MKLDFESETKPKTAAEHRKELVRLLEETVAAAKRRERSAFDKAAGPFADSIVLFGAGGLGRILLEGLRRAGVEPLAFSDNNPELWGTKVDGLQVLPPVEAAAKFAQKAVFVMSIWRVEDRATMAERSRQVIEELGCQRVVNFGLLCWKYSEILLPYLCVDLPHKVIEQKRDILRAFELWQDDFSRQEFVAQIKWRLYLDFEALPPPIYQEIYFPDDLTLVSESEVFVDCGAYDGDTLDAFLSLQGGSFHRFFAFEADLVNVEKLRDNVAALPARLSDKVTIYPVAVGARREKVHFAVTGTKISKLGIGVEVDCVTLDEVLANEAPTWIKMDIEGSEPEALAGAKKVIARETPVLAICVYHKQDHVWRLPLLIAEMSEDYRFFLRPHEFEAFDLVCYAIPTGRLWRG